MPFGGFGTDSPPRLPPSTSRSPVAATAATSDWALVGPRRKAVVPFLLRVDQLAVLDAVGLGGVGA